MAAGAGRGGIGSVGGSGRSVRATAAGAWRGSSEERRRSEGARRQGSGERRAEGGRHLRRPWARRRGGRQRLQLGKGRRQGDLRRRRQRAVARRERVVDRGEQLAGRLGGRGRRLGPEEAGAVQPVEHQAEAGGALLAVVALQGLEDAHLLGHEHLHPLAGGEGDLVLRREVAGVHQGEVEPPPLDAEGDGAAAAGELLGDQPDDLLRHPLEVVRRGRRDAELLGEPLEQQLLAEGVHLHQAGAEPAAAHVLGFQGAGELLDGDPAARHQELSELGHAFQGLSSASIFSAGSASFPRLSVTRSDGYI